MATFKQKRAFDKLAENGGSVSRAMRAAGYSPETAVTPGKLTGSKGWKELMDTYLPDSELAKVHREGLNAGNKIVKNGKVLVEIPDYAVRHKYLDSAYKLKGSYAAEKIDLKAEDVTPTSPEAKRLAQEYEEKLKKGL